MAHKKLITDNLEFQQPAWKLSGGKPEVTFAINSAEDSPHKYFLNP